jgi:hypothetical protein
MTQFSPFSSVKIHPRSSAPSAENSGTIQGYSCAFVSIRGFRLRGSGLEKQPAGEREEGRQHRQAVLHDVAEEIRAMDAVSASYARR